MTKNHQFSDVKALHKPPSNSIRGLATANKYANSNNMSSKFKKKQKKVANSYTLAVDLNEDTDTFSSHVDHSNAASSSSISPTTESILERSPTRSLVQESTIIEESEPSVCGNDSPIMKEKRQNTFKAPEKKTSLALNQLKHPPLSN